MRISKREYVVRATGQLNDLTVRLRRLADHASHVEPGSRAAFQLSMRRLWQRERMIRILLERIKKTKDDRWVALKAQEDREIVGLTKSYRHLAARYGHPTS